jgi:hypothetical protein
VLVRCQRLCRYLFVKEFLVFDVNSSIILGIIILLPRKKTHFKGIGIGQAAICLNKREYYIELYPKKFSANF